MRKPHRILAAGMAGSLAVCPIQVPLEAALARSQQPTSSRPPGDCLTGDSSPIGDGPEAAYRLALRCLSEPSEANDEAALRVLEPAATQGHPGAMLLLGSLLVSGRGSYRISEMSAGSSLLRVWAGQRVLVYGTVTQVERRPVSDRLNADYNLYLHFRESRDVVVRVTPHLSRAFDRRFGRQDHLLVGMRIGALDNKLVVLPSGQIEVSIADVDDIYLPGERPSTQYMRRAKATESRPNALEWLQKAGERGAVRAYTWMGLAYTEEFAEDWNYYEAARWFREASDKGDAWGSVLLADLAARGRGVERDVEAASSLYQRALDSQDPFVVERARAGLDRLRSQRSSEPTLLEWLFFLGAAGAGAAAIGSILFGSGAGADTPTSPQEQERWQERDRRGRQRCVERGGYWISGVCHIP